MSCEMDPADLNAFIDGEVPEPGAAAIARHVVGCASCRGELERARKVDDAIRRHRPGPSLLPMREDLVNRVVPGRRRLILRLAVPAAAVIAAFVIGVRLTTKQPQSGPGDGPRARPGPDSGMIEALELDAASLRLSLIAERPDPAVREDLDARLDAIVSDIEKLRALARSHN